MSRDINRGTPVLQELYLEFSVRMARAGIPFMITCVDRSILEQIALFVQGRMEIGRVNMIRVAAGLSVIPAMYNKVVTQTLNSRHVTNMYDRDLNNDCSRAFDIAVKRDGVPHWNLKVSVNSNEVPDYIEAGRIGKDIGLVWGGDFPGFKDYCHFQEPD
jgi:peptidoglycan L-alanyl-D-glutamate endopeptidase CwlK